MLTLYLSPGASSMAPHIALEEIGVPFEIKSVSFHKKEHQSPEFRAINPEGKVPTLILDDGHVLTETAGILFYLAKRFPDALLLPQGDLETEAQIVSWMSYTASTLYPARGKGLEQAKAIYAIADQRLDAPDWAVGRYSIADIHLFRVFWRFANALKPSREDLPHLWAHHDRMMERPAVRRTIATEAAIGYELP
jgi:glutathione S-transferase